MPALVPERDQRSVSTSVMNIVSSSSIPRPDTCWSNINPQAGWAYIYAVLVCDMLARRGYRALSTLQGVVTVLSYLSSAAGLQSASRSMSLR